jgi:protein gp37
MGKDSRIAWTTHTFNPWWGCQRVSPGCERCYAESLDHRVGGNHWGPRAERRFFGAKHWHEPEKWNAAAAEAGRRDRVFCASMADVFEDRDDLLLERNRLLQLISRTPHLDWLLLTKRPENMRAMLNRAWPGWDAAPLANVWLGCTVEEQYLAHRRIVHLLTTPAVIHFLSCEPLLGRVSIDAVRRLPLTRGRVDWVIAGGESGHGARPMNEDWVRLLRDECAEYGRAFFYKQRVTGGIKVERPYLDGRQWLDLPK